MSARLAEWLLRRLVPGPVGEALAGDLREEYETHVRPERGRMLAELWLWRQALLSVAGGRRARRGAAARSRGPSALTGARRREGGGDTWIRDCRHALRGLRRRPAFTAVALVTLALGIGANTAIFSVVNGVVLRPLPYRAPERLVRVWPDVLFPFELSSALEFARRAEAYHETTIFGRGLFTLTGDGEPEIVRGARVQANHFAVLGVRLALGRSFTPEEGSESGARVAIMGHGLWSRRYGSDPAVVGRTIDIGGVPHTVVGVLARGHQPLEGDWQLWVPIRMGAEALGQGSGMAVYGRLRDGVTVADAQAEARRIYGEWSREQGGDATPERLAGLRVVPLRDWIIGESRSLLLVLLGAVGAVLLIAAANVANLLLALGGARTRELALRRALGASRLRVVRQLLTESGVLGLIGGGVGVALAHGIVRLGVPRLPVDLPRTQEIGIDAVVLAFAVAVSLGAALLFGTLPALRAARAPVSSCLGDGGRGSTGSAPLRLSNGLVSVEVALAVVLVAGAGLMLKSFRALTRVDPGFDAAGVLTLRVGPPASVQGVEELVAFHSQVVEALRELPGARSAGAIQFLPMRPGGWWSTYQVEGRPAPSDGPAPVALRVVTPDYFATMRIAVEAGRAFTRDDRPESERVIVINQALARQAFPGEDPVGRRLRVGAENPTAYRVLGVVGDVRQAELQTASHPEGYFPLSQRAWGSLFHVVRLDGDPTQAAAAARRAVWSVHESAPISSVSPLDAVVGATVADTRFFTGLLTAFGTLALVLGAVGVYGVMSYVVSLRRRELGIRMALGAGSGRVLSATVRGGMRPVAVGLFAGLAIAAASGRLLAGALYEVHPADPGTLATVAGVLATASLAALYLPARRASRLDPIRVLRDG